MQKRTKTDWIKQQFDGHTENNGTSSSSCDFTKEFIRCLVLQNSTSRYHIWIPAYWKRLEEQIEKVQSVQHYIGKI